MLHSISLSLGLFNFIRFGSFFCCLSYFMGFTTFDFSYMERKPLGNSSRSKDKMESSFFTEDTAFCIISIGK